MRNLVLFTAAVSVLVFSKNLAFASIIIFTGGTHASGDTVVSGVPYTESGFSFNVSAGGSAFIAPAGTAFVTDSLAFTQPASITLTGPARFSLNSLHFVSTGSGINFSVLGNLFGGGTIAQAFSTTVAAFDVAGFSNSWDDLTSVTFSSTTVGADLALDNVDVAAFSPPAAVPEPATAAVLGLGTMVGAFCQYRRRKRATNT